MRREKERQHRAKIGVAAALRDLGGRGIHCKTTPMTDIGALTSLAVDLAARAVEVHRRSLGRVRELGTKSSSTDMVTEVDREAERVIVEGLRRQRPDDAILAEEETSEQGSTGVRWVIDPLDGTTNYIYGYPAFAVSIGVEVDGCRAAGVVR